MKKQSTRNLVLAAVFTAAALLQTSAVQAQPPRPTGAKTQDASPRLYNKVTVFNMAGDKLIGGLQKPFLLSINSRRLKKKGSLIKMRPNWKRKISRGTNRL